MLAGCSLNAITAQERTTRHRKEKGGYNGNKNRRRKGGKGKGGGGGGDDVTVSLVCPGWKLVAAFGAPMAGSEPIGGGQEGSVAAAVEGKDKVGGKRGKKGRASGGDAAAAAAAAALSSPTSSLASSSATTSALDKISGVVSPLAEWHLEVVPAAAVAAAASVGGVAGTRSLLTRTPHFSLRGHGKDEDRTVDLLGQALSPTDDSPQAKASGKGSSGGKPTEGTSKNGSGAAGELWTVRCGAADSALVLGLLELKVPGLVFLAYAHPGHSSEAAPSLASDPSPLGNPTGNLTGNPLWGRLQACMRSRCHHPLKGAAHLSLKGLDLHYLSHTQTPNDNWSASSSVATTSPTKNGRNGKAAAASGGVVSSPLWPAQTAAAEEGVVEVVKISTELVEEEVVSLRSLQGRLGIFYGRVSPPSPQPSATAAAAVGGAAVAKGANSTSKASPEVSTAAAVEGGGSSGGVDGEGGAGGGSEKVVEKGGNALSRGVALVRVAMNEATVRAAADDAVATLASSGVLADDHLLREARVAVVDLGNACWTHKHFSDDIQTRQYRCPEVILGAHYDTSADMWSLACIVFELLTGDLLFDPRAGDGYERDEDHLAQCIELIGEFPKKVSQTGKYAKNFFSRKSELKHIHNLRFWPLREVLHEKYRVPREEADEIAAFLVPLLAQDPAERATALDCLSSPWLTANLDHISDVDFMGKRVRQQGGDGDGPTSKEAAESDGGDAGDGGDDGGGGAAAPLGGGDNDEVGAASGSGDGGSGGAPVGENKGGGAEKEVLNAAV